VTVFDFHFVIDDVEKTPVGVHLRLAPVGLAPLFHLKTPVDAEDGAQHLEAPASQRHLVDLRVSRESVTKETLIVRRYVIAGDVERLVEKLVVGHVVADDDLLRFGSLTPSVSHLLACGGTARSI